MDAAIIENNALKLDEFQRALLADRLLDSIIPIPRNLSESWIEESENRLKAYQSGEISAVDGPQAMAELKVRYHSIAARLNEMSD